MARKPAIERFMDKVNKQTCWLWTSTIAYNGYGLFKFKGKNVSAHRFAYLNLVGEIPPNLELDHLCRVRNCVNPEHLEPVTRLENARRGPQATKVECLRGHPFDATNTRIVFKTGRRACKICQRQRVKQHRLRKLAKLI